ncbi:hypothetical protein [Komagataeibacter europaeus]|uniref:hypothetical protein n=1 Tax=Komagataeibacter europaeus TaxID=33995 RepID=UPI0015FB7CC1|nr:hypothetical protein [Komagataeibacter europaeus]
MRRSVTNSENDAYEKMVAGLRHAEEAAAELAMHRSDPMFMQIATNVGKMRERIVRIGHMAAVKRVGMG